MGVDGKRDWLGRLAYALGYVVQFVIAVLSMMVQAVALLIFMLFALLYLTLFLIWPLKKPKAADSRAGHEWRA